MLCYVMCSVRPGLIGVLTTAHAFVIVINIRCCSDIDFSFCVCRFRWWLNGHRIFDFCCHRKEGLSPPHHHHITSSHHHNQQPVITRCHDPTTPNLTQPHTFSTFDPCLADVSRNGISNLSANALAVSKSTVFFCTKSHLLPTNNLFTFSHAYRSISFNHCLTLLNDSASDHHNIPTHHHILIRPIR